MKMMMPMYFWSGNDVTYLFKSLTSETASGYALGIIATFLLGFSLELISYLRKYVHMKAQLHAIETAVRSAQNAPMLDVQISCLNRLLLTLVYLAMVTLAYFLMLLVMTYNVYLLVAAVAGLASGNLLFSLLSLPQLPLQYKFVEGKGFYSPESDKCCNAVEDARVSFASQRPAL